jgi:hypothetical protein
MSVVLIEVDEDVRSSSLSKKTAQLSQVEYDAAPECSRGLCVNE